MDTIFLNICSRLLGAKVDKMQCFFKVIADIYLNHAMNYTLLTTGKFQRYHILFMSTFIYYIKFYFISNIITFISSFYIKSYFVGDMKCYL